MTVHGHATALQYGQTLPCPAFVWSAYYIIVSIYSLGRYIPSKDPCMKVFQVSLQSHPDRCQLQPCSGINVRTQVLNNYCSLRTAYCSGAHVMSSSHPSSSVRGPGNAVHPNTRQVRVLHYIGQNKRRPWRASASGYANAESCGGCETSTARTRIAGSTNFLRGSAALQDRELCSGHW